MQWNVFSGTLTMSVVVLSSYDNAITKIKRGKKKSKRDKEQEVLPPHTAGAMSRQLVNSAAKC